jgi:16S rRNA (adenine1518-N6/adenine1519-N6)-dimethyltransferase
VREENGIEVTSTELAAELPAGAHTDFEFVELRLARHDGPMRCPPEEIACGEWFAPELIDTWVAERPQDFAKGFVSCWRAWRGR